MLPTAVVWSCHLKMAMWEAVMIQKTIRQRVGWVPVGHEELRTGRGRVINIAQNPHPQKLYCVAACSDLNL